MKREVMPIPDIFNEEADGEGHKLEALGDIKKMILQEIGKRGVIEGDDPYSENNGDRLIWTHALQIIIEAEQWLQENENKGKTLEAFMVLKEKESIKAYQEEESTKVKENDLDDLEDISVSCEAIRTKIGSMPS